MAFDWQNAASQNGGVRRIPKPPAGLSPEIDAASAELSAAEVEVSRAFSQGRRDASDDAHTAAIKADAQAYAEAGASGSPKSKNVDALMKRRDLNEIEYRAKLQLQAEAGQRLRALVGALDPEPFEEQLAAQRVALHQAIETAREIYGQLQWSETVCDWLQGDRSGGLKFSQESDPVADSLSALASFAANGRPAAHVPGPTAGTSYEGPRSMPIGGA